ncbi:hypothetical protein BST44_16545 [Mycobacterium scrofulaceum]|uniref:Uncharacterized protein n=2 Tax=Mycobacterium scrofulaceum TaxID=1783 RepID=A0A1X0KCX7_MYCSC|nr:hypothetical protein BST44_16545 [Mycobacterium scrofulaceum]
MDAEAERFFVEWYGPRAPGHSIGETAGRLNDGAASISARGEPIRLLVAMAVPDDDYAFGIFAAESAETVAQVCDDAGAPAERISIAVGWARTLDC